MAFTEQGVAMLSGILKSKRAVETDMATMRTFVVLRQWMESNKELAAKIRQLEKKYGQRFKISVRCDPESDQAGKRSETYRF